jgi:1-phosphofructokinase family hexose kinase
MIVTVSPNTALDRVRVIRGFQAGKQSRAQIEFLQPGGSGVHASSVIQALGGESIALGLLGGHLGELWKNEADRRGLIYDMVSIPAETRESFCLIDLDQGSIVENVDKGPTVSREIRDALLARLEIHLPNAKLLILSGSLPPGIPVEIYSDMIKMAKHYNVQTLADIHSEPLRLALPFKPWLIKPNLAEFHELIGHESHTLAERLHASRDFCRETGITLALSMSEAGLLMSTPDEQHLLPPPSIKMHLPGGRGQNVIGCGDALVGALAYEYCRSRDILAAAKLGVAAAHFNLSTFGVPEIEAEQVGELLGYIQTRKLGEH